MHLTSQVHVCKAILTTDLLVQVRGNARLSVARSKGDIRERNQVKRDANPTRRHFGSVQDLQRLTTLRDLLIFLLCPALPSLVCGKSPEDGIHGCGSMQQYLCVVPGPGDARKTQKV